MSEQKVNPPDSAGAGTTGPPDSVGASPPAGHGPTESAHDHEEHIHSQRHYVEKWAILVVLFLCSVAGPMIGIKWLTLIAAFGIAIVKAGMVVKYFMHLDVEKRFVHYFLATSLVFMFLFFAAVAPDVMRHDGTHWVNVAAQQAVERGLAAGDQPHGEHAEHGGGESPATHE